MTKTNIKIYSKRVTFVSQYADGESNKIVYNKKKMLQHESITPIESGITSSQILKIQN